jgi:hypothetical protein
MPGLAHHAQRQQHAENGEVRAGTATRKKASRPADTAAMATTAREHRDCRTRSTRALLSSATRPPVLVALRPVRAAEARRPSPATRGAVKTITVSATSAVRRDDEVAFG